MRLSSKHINVKEITMILHALTAWLLIFARCNLIIYDDNVAVVIDINKIFMHEETMLHLRWIVLLMTVHDICIHALWISTHENCLADLLSQAKFSTIADKFSQLAKLQSAQVIKLLIQQDFSWSFNSQISLMRFNDVYQKYLWYSKKKLLYVLLLDHQSQIFDFNLKSDQLINEFKEQNDQSQDH